MLSSQLQAQEQHEKRAGSEVLVGARGNSLFESSNAFVTALKLHPAQAVGPKAVWSSRVKSMAKLLWVSPMTYSLDYGLDAASRRSAAFLPAICSIHSSMCSWLQFLLP